MPTPHDENAAVDRPEPVVQPEVHGPRPLRSRALDWLLGAAALLILLVLTVGVLLLSVGRPAPDRDPVPERAQSAPSTPQTAQPQPPPGLGQDQVWFEDVELASASLVAAGTPLLDVVGRGRDVTSGQSGLLAGWVRMTGTVPFDVVAAELGPQTVVGPAGGNEVRVQRTVELLGRSVDVVATGSVTVADGRLVMVPTLVELEGGQFLSTLLTRLARTFVTIRHEIEGLPDGLVLRQVLIVDDGFRATLEGSDVHLTQ